MMMINQDESVFGMSSLSYESTMVRSMTAPYSIQKALYPWWETQTNWSFTLQTKDSTVEQCLRRVEFLMDANVPLFGATTALNCPVESKSVNFHLQILENQGWIPKVDMEENFIEKFNWWRRVARSLSSPQDFVQQSRLYALLNAMSYLPNPLVSTMDINIEENGIDITYIREMQQETAQILVRNGYYKPALPILRALLHEAGSPIVDSVIRSSVAIVEMILGNVTEAIEIYSKFEAGSSTVLKNHERLWLVSRKSMMAKNGRFLR